MSRHEQLERDLRTAAALFDDVSPSPDVWQENLRRLHAPRRRTPGLGTLAAVAAAVVLVLVVGGALLSGSAPNDGMPAGGSKGGDPWAPENVLGEPVQAETLTVDGARTVHRIVLTDTTGNGPDLCDRYVAGGSASGGCTSRDPKADDPSVAVDWLSGGEGNGLKGIVAAVDSRVAKVQVWMSNGDMVLAELHPTGWDNTRMFALTVQGDAPVPQRLVAYADASGTVLEVVELRQRFGNDWLPSRSGCRSDAPGVELPGAAATARAGTSDARVAGLAGATKPFCIPLGVHVGGAQLGSRTIVMVIGPEAGGVQLRGRDAGGATYDEPIALPGSLWRAQVVHADHDLGPGDRVAVLGGGRQVLQEMGVGQLTSALS